MSEIDEDNVDARFDEVELEGKTEVSAIQAMQAEVQNHKTTIRYADENWQAHVLSLLREDERVMVGDEIYPKCAGLRRLAELLLGDIVFMGPVQVFPSTDGDGPGRATVMSEVHIVWTRASNAPVVFDDMDRLLLAPRKFSDVSDVWIGNCQAPFVNHAVSTAATKALSRALKNALCLSISTAEEMAGNKEYKNELPEKTLEDIVHETVSAPISKAQMGFINKLCADMEIVPDKIAAEMFGATVEALDKAQASGVIKKLQQYKSEPGTEIPEGLKV